MCQNKLRANTLVVQFTHWPQPQRKSRQNANFHWKSSASPRQPGCWRSTWVVEWGKFPFHSPLRSRWHFFWQSHYARHNRESQPQLADNGQAPERTATSTTQHWILIWIHDPYQRHRSQKPTGIKGTAPSDARIHKEEKGFRLHRQSCQNTQVSHALASQNPPPKLLQSLSYLNSQNLTPMLSLDCIIVPSR